MLSIAYAMGQGGAGQGAQSPFSALVPLILMFIIFYFLLIRPQQKKAKEQRQMLTNLKKGDRIITGGGIYGRITGLYETTLTVEIADKFRVKVNRANVIGLAQPAQQQAQPAKDNKADKGKSN